MAKRDQHYENAFQDYLRSRGIPYVSVNEHRQAIFAGRKIKSFDFLVYPGGSRHWIVDVKGRHFPYLDPTGSKRCWENWVVEEDLRGLQEWEAVFGDDFAGYFLFAYLLLEPEKRRPSGQPHVFGGHEYVFWAVRSEDYEQHCRKRSTRWGTVSVPTRLFRDIALPVEALLP
ncbi:MAG TPA: HYExAFE family protein [Phycisphaerae bacterium]|nr:HYExAFE family protein [Phycisphaerae bacterium]